MAPPQRPLRRRRRRGGETKLARSGGDPEDCGSSHQLRPADMAIPHLKPSPDTVHWGFFEAALKPLVAIASGDRVTLSTVSGTRDMMPASPLVVPPALAALHASNARRMVPGHICTGQVAYACARHGPIPVVGDYTQHP